MCKDSLIGIGIPSDATMLRERQIDIISQNKCCLRNFWESSAGVLGDGSTGKKQVARWMWLCELDIFMCTLDTSVLARDIVASRTWTNRSLEAFTDHLKPLRIQHHLIILDIFSHVFSKFVVYYVEAHFLFCLPRECRALSQQCCLPFRRNPFASRQRAV